jgi:hypothetical protein
MEGNETCISAVIDIDFAVTKGNNIFYPFQYFC